MEAPIYHLEKVLHGKQEAVEDFVGPLDLILHLLAKNKIEIKDIPVAQILEQYLDWMSRRRELDLEIASAFIAMAAQLLYIKTRMLLSLQDEEALSEMELLIADLEKHRQEEQQARLSLVWPLLEEAYHRASGTFPTPRKQLPSLAHAPNYAHRPEELTRALVRMAERNRAKLPPSLRAFHGVVGRDPYPVERKAGELLRRLQEGEHLTLDKLLQEGESRSELVAVFIVVLELCRSGAILLTEKEAGCLLVSTGPTEQEGRKDAYAMDRSPCTT